MLDQQQRLAIFLHVNGYSNTEISAQIGVQPAQIRKWMKEPEFAQSLKDEADYAMARSRAQAQCAARRVADNACAATRAIQTMLLNDRTDPRIVVQCAKVMLQGLSMLSTFLNQPTVVPLLEAEDPTAPAEDVVPPNPATLRQDELTTIATVRRKLEEEQPEEKSIESINKSTLSRSL